MKKTPCYFVWVLVFSAICACGVVKGKGEAEKVAQALFQERIEHGGLGSKEYYSDLFWKNTDEKKWNNIQMLVKTAMGNLKSYSLTSWKVESKANTGEMSGTLVVLVYETVYEKGKGTETLTIHKPVMGDKFAILGHHFHSEKIQELINKGIQQAASGDSI